MRVAVCTMPITLFLLFIFCARTSWVTSSTLNNCLRNEHSSSMLWLMEEETLSLAEVIQPTMISLLSPLSVEGMYPAKLIALISCLKLN